MKMNKLSNFVFASVVGLGLIGAPVAATASPADSTRPTEVAATAAPRSGAAPAHANSDASRYAEREKNAGTQEDFRGGAASVYIGGSALTIALVIILLIVIL